MDLFVLYKCSLLITAVTRVQFSNSTSTNETDMTPHTLNVLSGNHDVGIGTASPLSHNAGSDINLKSMVEQQRCRLEETCHHKKLSSCDFTGCQLETKLYLQGLGESKWLLGTLPENLNAFLPNLKVLWVVDRTTQNKFVTVVGCQGYFDRQIFYYFLWSRPSTHLIGAQGLVWQPIVWVCWDFGETNRAQGTVRWKTRF